MKIIQLTKGLEAFIDDEDFDLINKYKWHAAKVKKCYYAITNFSRKIKPRKTCVKMHRLILGLNDPLLEVDHIDHNGLNNQKSNLRICKRHQNAQNRSSFKGTSKYIGVHFYKNKNKWCSQIRHKGKNITIGYFDNEIEAAKARDKKAIELRGEFANLNFK